jgi:raffinose/stachyose/melibiose transport system substrate-binding protein
MMVHATRATLVAVAGVAAALGCQQSAMARGVTLTLWHNTQDTPGVLALYKAYEKASGNTISLVDIPADGFETATLTKWASGDRPDILEYHPGLADLEHFNPSQNFIDLSNEAFVKQSSIYEIGGRASDSKVYAAITTFPETWGVYYNKKLLADHGLKPATSFDELRAQCGVLSKEGITTMHEAGSSGWPVAVDPLIYASTIARPGYIADVMAHKAKLNDPDSPMLAGYKDWVERKDAGCFNSDLTTATFEAGAKAVYEGKAAYQLIHSNIAAVYFGRGGRGQGETRRDGRLRCRRRQDPEDDGRCGPNRNVHASEDRRRRQGGGGVGFHPLRHRPRLRQLHSDIRHLPGRQRGARSEGLGAFEGDQGGL